MHNFRRSSIILLTAIYIMADMFGSFLIAGPVKAQYSDPQWVAVYTPQKIQEKSQLSITKVLTMSAMAALVNASSFFIRKLAQDSAKYIASGGKGEGALIFKDGVGKYMKNTALDSVGEAVDSLGGSFGLNLCEIPNPKLDISLRIGYRDMFPTGQEAKPKCSWKQLESSWGDIGNVMEKRYGPGGSKFVSETFNANLSVSQSDFGIALDAMSQLDNIHAQARAVAELERTMTSGIKDIVAPISGNIRTPARSIEEELKSTSASNQAQISAGQIAGLYGSQLESLPAMAAGVFLNTLVSSLLTNIMSGLFSDTPDTKGGGGLSSGIKDFYASALQSTKKSVERILSFLTAPTITQVNDYKVVDQLFAAKAIDTGLQQAVNRGSNSDTIMTIGEAAELNYLHRDWALIPPSHAWNNRAERDCYLKAYCYSNLQKIRKARILPVGFELAALKSSPDVPWTLGKVIDGFDDCNEFDEADASHPYCHLIDPNWVLKSPDARCRTEAVGPELIEDGVNKRQTECMDLETCISKSDNGTCNYWGYCTKEENIWRLGGETCPDYYSTCVTYKNTATKQSASYLSRTVDFASCDIKSVGCQAYSSEQSKDAVSGNWSWNTALTVDGNYKPLGRNQMAYFNRNVETCPSNAEGCSAFYGAQRDPNTGIFNFTGSAYIRDSANLIHLKKAPDYLSCYDANISNGLAIDWPKSKTEVLTKLAGNDVRCNDFAQVCAPEEVGCGKFSPTAGGSALTAIVDTNSACPQECVGYESFKQEESNFESGKFPMYFIPNAPPVKSCSARSVGCSEFTNLSSGAGGESLVYYSYTRLCEKPDQIDEKAFFSWEGSEREGYVLRNHLLKTINNNELTYITGFGLTYTAVPSAVTESVGIVFPVGSPSYGDNTKAKLQDNYNKCNVESYKLLITNPFDPGSASADCRQLYDSSGNIFYRILRDTVVIDASCQRLRKSDVNLFTDTNITDASQCGAQGGYWDTVPTTNVCKRCYGGGKYAGNTCIYEALPSESASCQAVDNGCRAYTGNAGNNIRPDVIFDTFEGDTSTVTTNWAPSGAVSVSAESLQTGQHSLKVSGAVNGTVDRVIPVGTINSSNSLNQNGWYELSFWARGEPGNLNISFVQGVATYNLFTHDSINLSIPNPITVGNDWQEYRLGPAQFTGTGQDPVFIRIAGAGSGDYFIDNFSLSQVEGSIYLVKDSWKQMVDFNGQQILADAPGSCYMGVAPGGSLPGAALGCREFKDESSNTYYLTNFSSLCREAAVGCQPMFESNNTVGEVLATVYNLVCTGPIGECKLTIGSAVGSCFIASGETSCHVPKMILPINDQGTPGTADDEYTLLNDLTGIAGLSIDISTVYILPENIRPIYLTNVSKYQCGADQRGCTLLGLQDQTIPTTDTASYNYSDTYILNNPDNYDSILCRQDLIGCNEYTGGTNAYYFKDPVKNGNYICSYKDDVDGFSGWFKDGVGACKNDENSLCKQDSDCPLVVGVADTCEKIGSLPCYPDYLQDETNYGIWSNKSTNYEGFVGACGQNFNGCTEFLDPQDTSSANLAGRPYYRVFDDRLMSNVADCQGQVSLKEGCVLFDKTDQPNKLYNTGATYAASDNASPRYSFVNPLSSSVIGTPNNANIILKVSRDRECSEWLACRNSVVVTNTKGQKEIQCGKYQACDKLTAGQGEQNKRDGCASFIDPVYGETFLDAEKYIDRDVSWYGFDYSGYSILQKHQVGSYEHLNFSNDDKEYLGVSVKMPSYVENVCVSSTGEDQTGEPCGISGEGRCYSRKCIYTIGNTSFKAVDITVDTRDEKIEKMREALLPATCKAYPEDTAPFPKKNIAAQEVKEADISNQEGQTSVIKTNSIGGAEVIKKKRTEFVILNDKFSGVNVCQDDAADCSCGYKKYTYGAGAVMDYYSISGSPSSTEFAPKGICNGGDSNGKPCGVDLDCGNGGSCAKLKQIDTKLGLFGFCLEPDLSRPINGEAKDSKAQEYACQTWLPIQTSASNIDLNNMNTEAGYDPKLDADKLTVGGVIYCANSLAGGITDKSMNLIQQNVTNGYYSSSNVAKLFDNKYFSYDCQINSEINCTTLVCGSFYDVMVNNLRNSAYAIKSLSGPLGMFPALSNYNLAYGSAFHHLICAQYDNVKAIKTAPPEEVYIMSSDIDIKYDADIQSNVYQSLQAWAWNKIGPSAVVVRAEYGVYDTYDTSGGFARVNELNRTPPIRDFLASGPSDEASNLGGRYVFENTDQFINENNIENIYFIPLNLKGTMRGLVPRQINLLSNVDPLTDHDQYLKLPIWEMNKPVPTVDGKPNGSIKAFQSMYIKHFPVNSDFGKNRIINWTGTIPGDFLNAYYNTPVLTYRVPKEVNLTYGNPEPPTTAPFLVWRYKAVKNNNNGYFGTPLNVQTKYVLSWFANDTYEMQYISREPSMRGYDTDSPKFMGKILESGYITDANEPTKMPADGWDNDPFNTDCEIGFVGSDSGPASHRRYNPWFAVAVNFDVNNKFLGFTTKWCDGLGVPLAGQENNPAYNSHWSTDKGGMNYAVIVELKNQCTEFVRVQDSDVTVGTRNKAWTNRVWGQSQNDASGTPSSNPLKHPYENYGTYENINRASLKKNFGSTSLNETDIENVGISSKLLKYYLLDPADQGIPYACDQKLSNSSIQNLRIFSIRPCGFSNTSDYRKGTLTSYTNSVLYSKALDSAYAAIHNLFALFFSDQKVNTTGANIFKSIVPVTVSLDKSNAWFGKIPASASVPALEAANLSALEGGMFVMPTRFDYLLPPRVFSLNPFTCPLGDSGGADCTAGDADNITVNQVNGKAKDYTADGTVDTDENAQKLDHISLGSFDADVRFFAYADDNRMPIRKVTVNWGDDYITNEDKQGYYKNSKPFCSENFAGEMMPLCQMSYGSFGNLPSGLTCVADKDCPIELGGGQKCLSADQLKAGAVSGSNTYDTARFGNTSRACATVPFEFIHSYTCSTGSPSRKKVSSFSLSVDTKARLLGMDVDADDYVCVFKPRVQVIDNWGYCNGVCGAFDSPGPADEYCYSGGNDIFKNNGPLSIDTGECKWPDFTALGYVFDPNQAPYTEYKGNIIIIPEETP